MTQVEQGVSLSPVQQNGTCSSKSLGYLDHLEQQLKEWMGM